MNSDYTSIFFLVIKIQMYGFIGTPCTLSFLNPKHINVISKFVHTQYTHERNSPPSLIEWVWFDEREFVFTWFEMKPPSLTLNSFRMSIVRLRNVNDLGLNATYPGLILQVDKNWPDTCRFQTVNLNIISMHWSVNDLIFDVLEIE